MTSEYVKVLVGVDNEQLDAIYNSVKRQLIYRLREIEAEDVPDELQHIVDEVTIARYNYIGSEGMSKENVEGHSATYVGVTLDDYEDEIRTYVQEQQGDKPKPKNVVRFL